MKPPKVVVVGSSNTDLVLACDRLPRPGETLLGGRFSKFNGGKGANQAVAAARAGARVFFIGCHGLDNFGIEAKKRLRSEKVDVRYFVGSAKHPSGVALILLGGKSRQNMIAVAESANDQLAPRHVTKAKALLSGADVIVSQLEVPLQTVIATARQALRFKIPFILNPAPAQRLPQKLLNLVSTIVPNEIEAEVLTGCTDMKEAAKALRKMGCSNIVITMGAQGALILDQDGFQKLSPPKVKVIDTVGAGDCFTAWLSVGIAEQLPFRSAVSRALKAASISVTKSGAQDSMPYRSEVGLLGVC